jgi:hypothetical protein
MPVFLLGEAVSKSHLFFSFYLFGIEAVLTVFMLIYINKNEIHYTTEDNIFLKIMLAATRVQ